MKRLALLFSIIVLASGICFAQTSGFTYQGKLADTGSPANGPYQFECKLFDAATVGIQAGSTQTVVATVTNGVFTTRLDFGAAAFPAGADGWLEIGVRPNGSGNPYTVLSPRQQVNSVPFAVRSLKATDADNATSLAGVTASNYVQTSDSRLSDARTPTAGSTNYIQNTTTPQAGSNFNVSSGTANILNAGFQFNIGGSRVLSNSGFFNLFAGVGAGVSNNSGFGNSFFGANSGDANIGGFLNSFFGRSSGELNSFGIGNNFVGVNAGRNNTIGSNNTFIGANSGLSNTVEDNNTFIGNNANGAAGITNATAIGIFASATQSNSLVLGSINTVNGATADTNVGIGTTAPTEKLQVAGGNIRWSNSLLQNDQGGVIELGGVDTLAGSGMPYLDFHFSGLTQDYNARIINDANGQLSVTSKLRVATLGSGSTSLCRDVNNVISDCSSSLRYKTDIKPFSNGLNFISRLRPIAFSWKDGGMKDVGFGAEDVAKISPLLVTYNASGQVEGVKYDRLSVLFVNAIKEQQTQIAGQQKLIEKQQQQIDLLKQALCRSNPDAAICKSN